MCEKPLGHWNELDLTQPRPLASVASAQTTEPTATSNVLVHTILTSCCCCCKVVLYCQPCYSAIQSAVHIHWNLLCF